METELSRVPVVLDRLGDAAEGLAGAFGATGATIGRAVRGILRAAASAIRDHGADVDEVIARIREPRKLDTSFRADIDRQIAEKRRRVKP